MTETSSPQDQAGYERYERVLAAVRTRAEFTLADVRAACPIVARSGALSLLREYRRYV